MVYGSGREGGQEPCRFLTCSFRTECWILGLKKTYLWKHLKKQIYWWYAQGAILRCIRSLLHHRGGAKTRPEYFFPLPTSPEIVTGIGVPDPPGNTLHQNTFWKNFLT